VVLKLVRPSLRNRRELSAVRLNVSGSAAIRREFGSLMSVAAALGSPPPLGVLVAPMAAAGHRIWLTTVRHPVFGRIVLSGNGDRIAAPPVTAFLCNADESGVVHVVSRRWPELTDAAATHLAAAIARFIHCVAMLGERIDSAQIHPLEIRSDNTVWMLDALVQVSGTDVDGGRSDIDADNALLSLLGLEAMNTLDLNSPNFTPCP
jgi:hypothetical protein